MAKSGAAVIEAFAPRLHFCSGPRHPVPMPALAAGIWIPLEARVELGEDADGRSIRRRDAAIW